MEGIERTRRGVSLERCDHSGLGNLVRAAVVHIDSREEEDVALLGHPRCDSLHDLAVDGLLVVGNEVLVQELLNLVGREPRSEESVTSTRLRSSSYSHPANILNDLNVVQGRLLKLQELRRLLRGCQR